MPYKSWLTETENDFMEPKFPMLFGGDEGHPQFIIWEYDEFPGDDLQIMSTPD